GMDGVLDGAAQKRIARSDVSGPLDRVAMDGHVRRGISLAVIDSVDVRHDHWPLIWPDRERGVVIDAHPPRLQPQPGHRREQMRMPVAVEPPDVQTVLQKLGEMIEPIPHLLWIQRPIADWLGVIV